MDSVEFTFQFSIRQNTILDGAWPALVARVASDFTQSRFTLRHIACRR